MNGLEWNGGGKRIKGFGEVGYTVYIIDEDLISFLRVSNKLDRLILDCLFLVDFESISL